MKPIEITDIVQGPVWKREGDASLEQLRRDQTLLYRWWEHYFGIDFMWSKCKKEVNRGYEFFVHPNGWQIVYTFRYGHHSIKVYRPGVKCAPN